MSDPQTLESMRMALEELRAEVEHLRAEVESVRHSPGTSLRKHNLCPMCGERSVLYVREVRDHSDATHSPMALQLKGIIKERGIGVFQVYICRGCEFAEWYVIGASDLDPETLDKKNRKNIRIIDGQVPAEGVFR